MNEKRCSDCKWWGTGPENWRWCNRSNHRDWIRQGGYCPHYEPKKEAK